MCQRDVERDFVQRALAGWRRAAKGEPTAREQEKFQQRSRRALRCPLLRTLLQEDYRGFSCQLAGNPLYQWFCLVDALDQVRVPSKSELQRFASADNSRTLKEGSTFDGLCPRCPAELSRWIKGPNKIPRVRFLVSP